MVAVAAFATACTDAPTDTLGSAPATPLPSVSTIWVSQFLECKQIKGDVPVAYPANAQDPHLENHLLRNAEPFMFRTDYTSAGQNYVETKFNTLRQNGVLMLMCTDNGAVNGFNQKDDGRAIYGSRKFVMRLAPSEAKNYTVTLDYSFKTNMKNSGGDGSSSFSLPYVAILQKNGLQVGNSIELIPNDYQQAVFEVKEPGDYSIVIQTTAFDARVQGYGNSLPFSSFLNVSFEFAWSKPS